MNKKTILILFITTLLILTNPPRLSTGAETTMISVEPPAIADLEVGDTFTINITVFNVTDLYAWQLKLYYKSTVLNATELHAGPFLGGSAYFYKNINNTYNATHGQIIAASTLVGVDRGVNGTGTLVTVTFKVKGAASSILHLSDTKLLDSAVPFGNEIPHVTSDGEVHVGIRDVAVTSVEISTTMVYEGRNVSVTVVVANNGDYTENFNVTVYYDENSIAPQLVSNLEAGSESTLTFLWDTTGVESNRSYTIKAVASTVPGETNLDNNILVGGSVLVRSYAMLAVKIVEVVPSDRSGQPASSFVIGAIAYFKVTVNNTAFESEVVLLTVNVYDSSNATLGVVSFQGVVMPGKTVFILGLPIPTATETGLAMVYANAFTDWPFFGGVPYCPEKSATFEIVGS